MLCIGVCYQQCVVRLPTVSLHTVSLPPVPSVVARSESALARVIGTVSDLLLHVHKREKYQFLALNICLTSVRAHDFVTPSQTVQCTSTITCSQLCSAYSVFLIHRQLWVQPLGFTLPYTHTRLLCHLQYLWHQNLTGDCLYSSGESGQCVG